MIREFIATGETSQIAFENACQELGIEPSKAQMEVLEEAVKKTFGLFGGSPAKVRAFVEITPKSKAIEYLTKIFSAMGVSDLEIEAQEDEAEGLNINLKAEDISFIIGHRGDTLDSLQYLTSLVANQGEDKYMRISIDVGTFREKRKETLEKLGKKIAQKAIKYGKNQILEPMNPYERRIIHFAANSVEGVKSWSEGEDLTRHVVIGPVDGERKFTPKPRFNKDRRPNNNSRDGKRPPYNKNNNNRNFNKSDSIPNTKENNEFRKKVQQAVIYDNTDRVYESKPLDDVIERKKDADAPLYGRIR
ncbi:MAG: RNA-binding cell elongation regulator Jag/EloR [Clostridia bacterium]